VFDDFLAACEHGALPSYSFIEPRYYPDLFLRAPPNDMHPPHNILAGEQLVADTYNALRQGPGWERTLFVITFDEHGGCYDHSPPPKAVPPGPPYTAGFTYDRYGVRVPAVVISPYVPAGSIVRPPAPLPDKPAYPFDHTSLIATLQRRFDLGPPMTLRVASAPDLSSALSLERPDNKGPERIDASRALNSGGDISELVRERFNHHQETLRHPAMRLPGLFAQAAGHAHRVRRRAGRRILGYPTPHFSDRSLGSGRDG
jgi:phospholipase C